MFGCVLQYSKCPYIIQRNNIFIIKYIYIEFIISMNISTSYFLFSLIEWFIGNRLLLRKRKTNLKNGEKSLNSYKWIHLSSNKKCVIWCYNKIPNISYYEIRKKNNSMQEKIEKYNFESLNVWLNMLESNASQITQ